MKKKILLSIICLVLILVCISGCQSISDIKPEVSKDEVSKDEVMFVINLDSPDDIYQVSMDFFVDGQKVGDAGTRNADGKSFEKNTKIYQSVGFKDGIDLSKLSVQFYVANTLENNEKDLAEHNVRYKAGEELSIPVAYGNIYSITLFGDKENGFKAELQEE